jgi:hypothetical protein
MLVPFLLSTPLLLVGFWLAMKLHPQFVRFAQWLWADVKRLVALVLVALGVATIALHMEGVRISADFMVSSFPIIIIWPVIIGVALILSWMHGFDEEGEKLPTDEERRASELLQAAVEARNALGSVRPTLQDAELHTLVESAEQRLHQAIAAQRQRDVV